MGTARRTTTLALAIAALGACSSPRIDIAPRLTAGQTRTYQLETRGHTAIDVPGLGSQERTLVQATVTLDVVKVSATGSTVRVTLQPTRFERDGRSTEAPPEERAELALDGDGDVVKVTAIGGAQSPLGGSAEDLGALLGSPIRRERVRLGDRWRRRLGATPAGAGSASSRVAALRVVDGERCVVVASAATKPVERGRQVGGTTLRLTGTEQASTETVFAFDAGLPVSILSNGEGRYRVVGGQGGSVVVRTTTRVRLQKGAPEPAPTPTATRSGSPTGSPRPRRS